MMSRELGAIVISVSYRIGPFHQFPAAIHDAEDVLSAILDTEEVSKAGKVLRTEINRYNSLTEANRKLKRKRKYNEKHMKQKERHHSPPNGNSNSNRAKIVLDPTRLCISGFSAGGNIALNMAINVPPCFNELYNPAQSGKTGRATSMSLFSPVLPPTRTETILDDPNLSWPSVLPPTQAQPRMVPLLLFYPSLDARLLPHERPRKALPKALKGDDKKTQKPKAPGLFSIMGPTYLPKKLRAHPRASPGLVDPDDVQKNASIFLVLSEKDSLAVQSDIWVDKMNTKGWNGPVRFGDGREGDWDGKTGSGQLGKCEDNGGLEVWHAPDCRHGWTQFPTPALGPHERKERDLVFARALDFVKEAWNKTLPVEEKGNKVQELRPLQIPSDLNEGLVS
jgi:acetyl esterase/lipase